MDNNLISNKKYAKDLFRKMKPLKKWWWSQVSIDMAKDKELMRLAAESGGLSVVIGIESFSKESLKRLGKRQNKVSEYKNAIKTFHEYGFYVIGMFIIGLDEDTTESIRMIPDMIQEVGLDMPFPNILTPFYGTKIYEQFDMENRIATKDWSLYTGFNTVFQPKNMSVNELNSSYIEMWKEIYSVKKTFKRVFKNIPIPIPGYPSFLWKTLENGFFMSQNLMGKYPIMRMNDKDTFTAEETKQPSKLTAGTVNTP